MMGLTNSPGLVSQPYSQNVERTHMCVHARGDERLDFQG